MVNEVVDDLLLLAVADLEDVAALHVDDVRSVAVPVMQLELIDTKKLCLMFRLTQLFAVNRIRILQALFIDCLDNVFPKAGDLGNLLECICSMSQKIPGVLVQFFRDPVPIRFKRDELGMCPAAFRTPKLVMRKHNTGEIPADAKMPQSDLRMLVHMHPRAALRTDRFFRRDIQRTVVAEDFSAGYRFMNGSLRIMEAIQAARNHQKIC